MPAIRKKICKNGIWIDRWRFQSNKKPFASTMTIKKVLEKQRKIVKYLRTKLRDRKSWEEAKIKYEVFRFNAIWEFTPKTKFMVFHLTVQLLDPIGPPVNDVIAPPPPKQPPPPNNL